MEQTKKSSFATASLVLGIIAICFAFIPIVNYISFILGILAIIFSIVSLCKKSSKGLAIAGLILAIIAIFIANNMNKGFTETVGNVIEDITKEEKIECNQGEKAILGDSAVTVTKVEKSQGDSWNKPASGKEYVIVTVSIENKGQNNLSYNPYDFKMQNSQGQQESITFTTIDQDTELNSGELISGGKITGTVVFEQPKGDTGLVLIYSNSIWSSKELKINLK